MTRDDVKRLLLAINSAYPNFHPADMTMTVDVWTGILEPYDNKDIQNGFVAYCRANTSGFAPSPSQLIEFITKVDSRGITDDYSAWSLVSKALRNSTYNADEEYKKLPEEVQQALGGSYQLHTWATDENFNESVVSSHFLRAYRTVLERKNTTNSSSAVNNAGAGQIGG